MSHIFEMLSPWTLKGLIPCVLFFSLFPFPITQMLKMLIDIGDQFENLMSLYIHLIHGGQHVIQEKPKISALCSLIWENGGHLTWIRGRGMKFLVVIGKNLLFYSHTQVTRMKHWCWHISVPKGDSFHSSATSTMDSVSLALKQVNKETLVALRASEGWHSLGR